MSQISRRQAIQLLAASTALPYLPAWGGARSEAHQTAVPASQIAEQLSAYAHSLSYDKVPANVIERVKAHFIDAIGCAIAAWHKPKVEAARKMSMALPASEATIWGTSVKTSMELASFANGAAIRYLDLNDSYSGNEVGHPSDNMSACMAAAEAMNCNGEEFILSVVLAYEITCRLLDTVQISKRGWDHPNFSLPAVALAAGKVMRLSEEELVQAVNLSLAGHLASNQTRLQNLSNWKGLADAESGRNALFAARLARAGFTGPSPAFEGNAGFFSQVSGPFTLQTSGFGGNSGTFRILDCRIKPYPAQALLQTAIAAAAKIRKKNPDISNIRAITIFTSKGGIQYSAESPEKFNPLNRETADHSLPFIVAKSLIEGEISDESYSKRALNDPALKRLLQKTSVKEDARLSNMYPDKMPNRVEITLEDQTTLVEEVIDLPGFGGEPLSRTETEEKFLRSVSGAMSPAHADHFLSIAWRLESSQNLQGVLAAIQLDTPHTI